MELKIRKAKLTDLDKIIKLVKNVKAFKVGKEVVGFWPKTSLKKIIKSKDDIILLAEQNNELVGFIIINYNINFNKAVIENIFVEKKHRGRGIGRRLLAESLKLLKKRGCGYLCALVNSKNSKEIKWHIKQNFDKGINCLWLDMILDKSFRGK